VSTTLSATRAIRAWIVGHAALFAGIVAVAVAVAVAVVVDPVARQPAPDAGAAGSQTMFERHASAAKRCKPRVRFAAGRWPPACWRPYSPRSPFNRRIPANPKVDPDSSAIVARMLSFGPAQHLLAGGSGTALDYYQPTYYPRRSDPVFRLHCTYDWGRCEVEGLRVRIPDAARPAGGSDGHMTVLDQRSGWEYDMWRVQRKPRGGGRLDFAWGGRTRIGGDGRNSDATASRFGNVAGAVRAEELASGRIAHALFLTVHCDSGRWVYPASKSGQSCSEAGESNADAPPMGARFQLAMRPDEIAALNVPEWKKTILTAMATYGMYVGDTGGSWALEQEGGLTYTSFGHEDRWVSLAKRLRVPFNADDGLWFFNLQDGVDWARYLRVLDPCEARGSC
jgi:hypothetical protein